MNFLLITFLLVKSVISETENNIPPSCASLIYCQGDLLHQVQLARIFNDSKTFVDKSLRFDSDEVLKNFNNLKSNFNDGQVTRGALKSFINENFLDSDSLEMWSPPDWTPKPSIISKINNPEYQKFALDLNTIWQHLGRKMNDEMKKNPDRHSFIPIPNGFIVPGGRFNEIYYWDTLWVIKGLLLCDMHETAKGIIENLMSLVNLLGHVPNGNRVYYTERSQPPVLTLMVEAYYKATGDFEFIKDNIQILDREMDYWNGARMVDVSVKGNTYKMYRYHAVSSGPRPESYREDFESALRLPENERLNHYIELKSGAESGWDFSSRWYKTQENPEATLSNIRTSTIVPVDLNALLQKSFRTLSAWYSMLGDKVKSSQYADLASDLQKAIKDVLWDSDDGIWYDYDLKFNTRRKLFLLSNFVPLWTESYDFPRYLISDKIMHYIKKNRVTTFVGGTPTSLDHSLQQWDYPNAWPPLQAFLIQGLLNIGTTVTTVTAYRLAHVWLNSNYRGFQVNHKMYEKYNALGVGTSGGGGEYAGQDGFGWTNGFALELMNMWGSILRPDSDISNNNIKP